MAGRDRCRGKLRHPSREFAEANVEQLRASSREHKSRIARLEAYQCPDCGEWHVGHGKGKPLARTA